VGTDTALEIRRLTGLRKLGVVGVNKKNGPGFCLALHSLNRLESLTVNEAGGLSLSGCLESLPSPPESLQSLKVFGILVTLPTWVGKLENLVKLRLCWTNLSGHDSAMQVLGNLPKLKILRLGSAFEDRQLKFQREAFKSLSVIELSDLMDTESVMFQQGTMPKLEQLKVCGGLCKTRFRGLESLPSLKEVLLHAYFPIAPADWSKFKDCDEEQRKEIIKLQEDSFRDHLRIQLSASGNPKKPILKVG
jgi:hypothetical protein